MQEIPSYLLHSFMAFGRFENTSQAADSLKISQPSLSRHLKDLEGLISIKLFVSEGRNKRLGPFGHELFAKLDEHWIDYSLIVNSAVQSLLAAPQTPVSIFGPLDWLVRLGLAVNLKVPLRCVAALSEQVEPMMRKHKGICLGLTRSVSSSSPYRAVPIIDSKFQIIFSKKWNVECLRSPSQKLWKELAHYPRIAFREDTKDAPFVEQMGKHSIRTQLIVPSWQVITELVRAGKGWAIAPSDVINHYLNRDSIEHIDLPDSLVPGTRYYLLYSRDYTKLPWFQALVHEIELIG